VPAQDDSSHAAPVNHKLLTPGVWTLITLLLLGVICGLYRFIFGLAASTNLDQQHPWGLWIAMDVGSGIALAGGGFVTAALVHISHREHYHAVARSALLTALLGYTFYVPGLLADIGRWYNIWHPTLPSMWQGNSVLFEVGICVMLYLNVQYAELLPIICERVMTLKRPRIARIAKFGHDWLEKIMPALLVLGVALSTFHQSSLGNLMVIAPYKLHRLWWTPVSPLLFLLSAMMVGFPMVIFTILFASWSLNRKPEMHVLGALARYIPIGLTLYLGVKIGDMIVRRTYVDLVHDPYHSVLWIGEMLIGVVVPLAMLLMPRVRQSARLLGVACLAVILGVVLNRLNCFVLAYHPPFATKAYFPSLIEFGVSIGLVAALMLTYRVAVTYLPILEPHIAPEENATQRPQRRRERREILACASLLCGLCVSAVSVLFLFSRTASADPTTQPATQPLGPKVVVLDELSALYKPVPFAHEEHAKMAQMWDGCKTCHHREPKVAKSIWLPPNIVPSQELTTVIPKCSSCHEPSVTAVDMHTPNLKGALHRQCLNCHREWMHENACVVCHEPRDPTTKLAATTKPSVDDIVGRIHPPIDPPDVKTYRPRFTPAVGVNIIFRHKEHTASYGLKCVSCHHRDNCAHCHDPAQNTSEQKILRPGRTWRASHEPCIGCHEKDRCKTCHYSDTEDPPSPGSRKANNRPATEPANVTAVAPTTKPTIVRIRSGGS
jgi:Ni/Fe-hydrogenase subunit HybB-like protein